MDEGVSPVLLQLLSCALCGSKVLATSSSSSSSFSGGGSSSTGQAGASQSSQSKSSSKKSKKEDREKDKEGEATTHFLKHNSSSSCLTHLKCWNMLDHPPQKEPARYICISKVYCKCWCLNCVVSLSPGEGVGSQEDQLCMALVSQLNKFADKETLIQFLRCFLLESNSSAVRWQAHCLALHIYRYYRYLTH